MYITTRQFKSNTGDSRELFSLTGNNRITLYLFSFFFYITIKVRSCFICFLISNVNGGGEGGGEILCWDVRFFRGNRGCRRPYFIVAIINDSGKIIPSLTQPLT